jgi:outer membrane lipoprotein-sorting protein
MNSRHSFNSKLQALFVTLSFSLVNPGLAEGTQLPGDRKVSTTLSALTGTHSQEMTKDGADFLKEMASAASSLKTYSFLSHMTVFKDGKEINENSRFYFKQPRQIRAEELGPYKKGSLAVLLKNGKVKGHLGGLLSKITGTVDSDSDWVRSANGYPLVDSDFFGMSQVMLNFVKEGKKSLVTEAPVTVPGQPQQVYVLELYSNAARTELMKRAYIDPQTLLPVEWFDYKNGKLFAHTNWKDVQINNDVSDSLFDI